MVEIAVDLQRALRDRRREGRAGAATPRLIAHGEGWRVADVLCTSGPGDRRFEEQHTHDSVAIVLAGTFQLRSPAGEALMVPGSLMLGNHGECFECGHEHGHGDRCVSFYFEPGFLERVAYDGAGRRHRRFDIQRIPPVGTLSRVIVEAAAGVAGRPTAWDEVAVRVAHAALSIGGGETHAPATPPHARARVTRIVRTVDDEPEAPHSLATLARRAGLSPFHFLRTFERVVGLTPHQYVRRVRLRHAARRLMTGAGSVLEVALDCGFGDVSNFNRAFRSEFGVPPTALRHAEPHRLPAP